MTEAEILYQNGPFWTCHTGKGYEVYEDVGTHSVRVSSIGFPGAKGLARAKQECDTREALNWIKATRAMGGPNNGD